MEQRLDKEPLAVFDEEAIELLVGSGAEKKARFLRLFLERSSVLIEQISAARTSGDLAVMKGAAHQLKSSSASIGAFALSDLLARIEALASSGGGDLPETLEELAPVYRKTCDAIQAALPRPD